MQNSTVLDKWKSLLKEALGDNKKTRARMIVTNSELIFFFMYKGEPYGSSENGRLTFAKMKDRNDEDNNPEWRKESSFTASNLYRQVDGEENQTVFGNKELKDIKVISKEEVDKLLLKHASKD